MGSKPISIGPYTPWPHRAEVAIRVFKATFFDRCSELGTAPEVKGVTALELLRQTVTVINSMVTYGGKAIVKLFVRQGSP